MVLFRCRGLVMKVLARYECNLRHRLSGWDALVGGSPTIMSLLSDSHGKDT
jgi:hypothetical protein